VNAGGTLMEKTFYAGMARLPCIHSGRSMTLILQAGVIEEYHQADFGQI